MPTYQGLNIGSLTDNNGIANSYGVFTQVDYTFNDQGLIEKANCIIPTGQNLANIELDMRTLVPQVEALRVDPDAAALARQRYGCLTPWQAEPGAAAVRAGALSPLAGSLAGGAHPHRGIEAEHGRLQAWEADAAIRAGEGF